MNEVDCTNATIRGEGGLHKWRRMNRREKWSGPNSCSAVDPLILILTQYEFFFPPGMFRNPRNCRSVWERSKLLWQILVHNKLASEVMAPTRHVFNYWAADRTDDKKCWSLARGFLGCMTFHFFGPLASEKINDPYDMSEAWDEFQLRAEVGQVLAQKDTNRDGFVQIEEHLRSMSVQEDHTDQRLERSLTESNPLASVAEVDETKTAELRHFLQPLGLESLLEVLMGAECNLNDLKQLAKHDRVCCVNVLKDAGIITPGHHAKIVVALLS